MKVSGFWKASNRLFSFSTNQNLTKQYNMADHEEQKLGNLYDRAKQGGLDDMWEFCIAFLDNILERLGLAPDTFTNHNNPDPMTREVIVFRDSTATLYGKISATDDIEDLKTSLITQLPRKAVYNNKHCGFVFAPSEPGRLAFEFVEVRPDGTSQVLEGGPLNYETERHWIEGAVRKCYGI